MLSLPLLLQPFNLSDVLFRGMVYKNTTSCGSVVLKRTKEPYALPILWLW